MPQRPTSCIFFFNDRQFVCMISLLSLISASSNEDMYLKIYGQNFFLSHDSMKHLRYGAYYSFTEY